MKYKSGTVHPTEYAWKKQFGALNPIELERVFDVGKVYGLAIYCEELEKERDALRADLKWIMVCAEDMFREGDKGYQIAIFARKALGKD